MGYEPVMAVHGGPRTAIDHARAMLARPTEISDENLHERARPPPSSSGSPIGRGPRRLAGLPARHRDVLVEVYFRDRSAAGRGDSGVPEGLSSRGRSTRQVAVRVAQRGRRPDDLTMSRG
jgi:hypothetical protein